MLESVLIEKEKGAYKASLRADLIDGQFHSISFGIVSKNDTPLSLYLYLSPYGLKHTYEGEDKDKVDEIVGEIEQQLVSDYNLAFEEFPQMSDIVEPENTEE